MNCELKHGIIIFIETLFYCNYIVSIQGKF
jgi:hypothetical protein